jgi:hypothetical protein
MYKAFTTLTIFLLLLSTKLYSNQIDDLKTDQDVYEFAKRIYPQFTEYDYANLRSGPQIASPKNCIVKGCLKAGTLKTGKKLI